VARQLREPFEHAVLSALKKRLSAVVAVLALAAAAVVATTASAPMARADGNCTIVVVRGGDTICVINGQQGGGPGGGDGNGVSINCSAAGTIVWDGNTYQCAINGWSFSGGCYIQPVVPQPATDDPIWGSYDPSTNRAQWEDCRPGLSTKNPPSQVGAKEIIGPCVGYCAGPNPVERITKELQIAEPDLGMSPPGAKPGAPAAFGFVNTNVWFWSKGLDTSTQTRSAGNVVGTRTFVSANWQIFKGNSTVPLQTPGLTCTSDYEYTTDKAGAPSPDPACGFQFTDPDTYRIVLTTSWTLVITQNGVPNQQTITSVPNTVTITIHEGQSNNLQSPSPAA
jgi:hypothetical protein